MEGAQRPLSRRLDASTGRRLLLQPLRRRCRVRRDPSRAAREEALIVVALWARSGSCRFPSSLVRPVGYAVASLSFEASPERLGASLRRPGVNFDNGTIAGSHRKYCDGPVRKIALSGDVHGATGVIV